MSDRFDEMKGKAKKSVGKLTGNEDLEREGETEETTAKAEREAKGAVDQGAGKAEETYGDLAGDEEAEAKGQARQAQGDIKRSG